MRNTGWWRQAAGAGVMLLALGSGAEVVGQPQPAASTGRIRPTDAAAAELLDAGMGRSATFRQIIDALEGGDVVVWVRTGQLANRGETHFIAATSMFRIVRVGVRTPGLQDELLSTLAHELFHALEIAGASEVRNPSSMAHFYSRTGWGGPSGGTSQRETSAAQAREAQVREELRGSPRSPAGNSASRAAR